jgi:hypothetical protein
MIIWTLFAVKKNLDFIEPRSDCPGRPPPLKSGHVHNVNLQLYTSSVLKRSLFTYENCLSYLFVFPI